MPVKIYIETDKVKDFLDVYNNHPDIHAEVDEYIGDVRIQKIHVDPRRTSIYDANCDIVYDNERAEGVPLYRIKLYRYDFKEGDYGVNSKGEIYIIGKIKESRVYVHAFLEDTLVVMTDWSYDLWLLSTLHPCKDWQIRAMDAELLRIGKQYNRESKQIEDV